MAGVVALAALVFLPLAREARATEADEVAARTALEALCIGCHRRDVSAATSSTIDLDRMVRERALVQPGNPEGSPLLTRLLRHESPHDEPGIALPRPPTPSELLAVRRWIAQLPVTSGTCDPRGLPALDGLDGRLKALGRRVRSDPGLFRVVTMAHLDAACLKSEQLASWRRALSLLFGALAGRGKGADLYPLDDRGAVLALDLRALDWDESRWRIVVGDGAPTVRADWLVTRIVRGELGVALAGSGTAKPGDRARVAEMLRLVALRSEIESAANALIDLVRRHDAKVDLRRAAAELDVAVERLAEQAASSERDTARLIVRLAQGGVPRAEIEPLLPVLARSLGAKGAPGPTTRAAPAVAAVPAPEVELHTDKLSYASGDAVVFSVRSAADCYLTVISIDTRGRGTVIFPNDLEPYNFLRAGETQKIPADGAGYRFRLTMTGRESAVAICAASETPPDGIVHDFERQRFQELGDYAAFLERAWTGSGDAAGGPSVQGTRGRGPAPPLDPRDVWRTGVTVEIK